MARKRRWRSQRWAGAPAPAPMGPRPRTKDLPRSLRRDCGPRRHRSARPGAWERGGRGSWCRPCRPRSAARGRAARRTLGARRTRPRSARHSGAPARAHGARPRPWRRRARGGSRPKAPRLRGASRRHVELRHRSAGSSSCRSRWTTAAVSAALPGVCSLLSPASKKTRSQPWRSSGFSANCSPSSCCGCCCSGRCRRRPRRREPSAWPAGRRATRRRRGRECSAAGPGARSKNAPGRKRGPPCPRGRRSRNGPSTCRSACGRLEPRRKPPGAGRRPWSPSSAPPPAPRRWAPAARSPPAPALPRSGAAWSGSRRSSSRSTRSTPWRWGASCRSPPSD
mmetsp:Transcript_5727/g.16209  ORF Transcript_5727/g.16209 Transcript_5727/m.16209 type:complete len:338 (-) Transcript_5727:131-1144(-)